MSTLKIGGKQVTMPVAPFREHVRRQTTWIRRGEQLKNWRKVSLNQEEQMHKKNGYSKFNHSERKSDITQSGRLSDETLQTNSTGSSSEPSSSQYLNYDDIERRQTIEKCLKWMEALPNKFSGMHVLAVQTTDS
ncbi:hypothetical protein CHS0354_030496 [Potamilus streckersoni]|uniref:Uncharacterized protein n=1 Tax=Potamilus streckersoni TaxID=2493646 RepID=A0AAE0RQ25_9BIVA|nr:hypothetical protein CHS0354_030496 [Potamilus streckersoni]